MSNFRHTGDVARVLLAAALAVLPAAAGTWAAAADIVVSGQETSRVGNGRNDDRSLTVENGGSIEVGNSSAVSLGSGTDSDKLEIVVENGATVSNNASNGGGLYGTGANTIEVGDHTDITIDGSVLALGSQNNAEAINVHGGSNTITVGVDGVVYAANAAAIWFQDETSTGERNVVDNYGIIQRGGTIGVDPADVHGNVIGTSRGNGIEFINRTGAKVYGSLQFSGGDDSLTFYAGSLVTGDIDGGGGTNDLTLNGTTGSYDVLAGAIKNFTSLLKDGDGTWTISGPLEGFTTVTVRQGVLGLTGNNDGYRGNLVIESAGTVRARAQSLPTNHPTTGNTQNIQNDGTLNLDQRLYDDNNNPIAGSEVDGRYQGQIYGDGRVVKSGGGTVVLAPDAAGGNTYMGGTVIEDGTLAISRDEALGDASGGLTMGTAAADGGTNGTLRFDADNITLSPDRDITLEDGGGTFDTQGYTATITQDIAGTGALTKIGEGVLVLGDAGSASTYDGVNINQGTIAIRSDGALGVGTGDLNFGTNASEGNYNGTLRLDESVTLSPDRTITLNDGGGTINTNGADVIGIINQDIGGTGSLTKTGAGTLDLTSNGDNNTYTGGTIIADGTVMIDDIGDLGTGGLTFGSATTTGTLQLVDNDVDLANAGPVTLAAGGGVIDTNGQNGILSQDITGTGDLTKRGAGDLDLTAASGADRSYTGATHIEDGSVTIAADGDLGSAGSWLTFGTDGAGATTGTLIVTDDVEMSSRPMYLFDGGGVIDTNGHTVTAEGNISGTGKLTKDGAGVLELYGANSYQGGTDVLEGTLAIDSGAALGAASGPLHMYDGTTLRFDADLTLSGRPVEIGGGAGNGIVIVDTNGHDGGLLGTVSGTAQLQKDGDGILALYGTNTYAGGTHVTQGTLAINSDASLGAAGTGLEMDAGTTLRLDRNVAIDDRTITLNGTAADTVTIDTNGWTGSIGENADIIGGAGLTKAGTGLLILDGTKTYTGPTVINAGVVQVNGQIGTAAMDVTVASGAVLEGIGTVVGTVINSGLVSPGQSSTGAPIGTLTIDGDYQATAGAGVVISTVLGNDNSPTSVLHITGDVADGNPASTVYVNNLNGTGAETNRGIEIIVVDGFSSSTGFRLDAHHVDDNGVASVVGGAYLYYLKQGDAYDDPASMNNWYLLNVLHNDRAVYQPNVPLFEVYPQVLQQFNKLPTLVQRVGHRSWGDADEGAGSEYAYGNIFDSARRSNPGPAVWVRMEGSLGKYHPYLSSGGANYKMDHGMAHLGLDWPLLRNNCGNQLVLGLTGHMGYGKAWVNSSVGRGKIKTTSPGFGATLTWYGRSGFYADAQTRFNYTRSDIDSHTLLIQSQVNGNHGFGQAYSLELGQIIDLGGKWSLTPQGQLSYSKVDFDDFQDRYGTPVSMDRHNSLESRLGIALNWENSCANSRGEVSRTKLYTQFDFYHEFKGKADITVAGVSLNSKPERSWFGVAVGGTRNWKDDKYSLYGELSARSSTRKFGASHVYSGEVGFRVSF